MELNQITSDTEVKAHSEKNLTTFTIPVGLHPKDIESILEYMVSHLKNGCDKTKSSINVLNQELEYITRTLNIK